MSLPCCDPWKNGAIGATAQFLPVTAGKCGSFAPFFKSFANTRLFPRFYQSILEMSQFVTIPQYYYGIIDDCLIFIKKRYTHTPVLKLMLPPISLNKDLTKEKEIIENFRQVGIGIKLSEEDLELYDYEIDGDLIKEDDLNVEFIYQASDYALMKGKKHKNNRSQVNKAKRKQEEGRIEIVQTNEMDVHLYKKCQTLYLNWCISKEKTPKLHSAHKVIRKLDADNVEVLITYIIDVKTKKLIIWGINENLGNSCIVITSRFRNYNIDIVEDPTVVLHHYECKYWFDKFDNNAIMNYGSGVIPGLTEHKKKLRPIKQMQIYNTHPYKQITKEEWDGSCIKGKTFKRLL